MAWSDVVARMRLRDRVLLVNGPVLSWSVFAGLYRGVPGGKRMSPVAV